MATEVIMPKVDMVMETGTFVEWLKQEGDTVEKGEPLFVISTEKAAIEVDSPEDGILAGLTAKPDDIIPVTEVIGFIVKPGEKVPEKSPVSATIIAVEPDQKLDNNDEKVDSSFDHQVSETKPRVTPLARRMAEGLGINLWHVSGRGPKGRIHKADILEYQRSSSGTHKIDGYLEEITSSDHQKNQIPFSKKKISGNPLPNARQKEVISLTGTRKIIADRMVYSAFSAPHIHLTLRVDMTDVLRFRQYLHKAQMKNENQQISITSILAYCVTRVLPGHPLVNSSLVEDKIILWEDIHLGIAMDVDGNLIVPVIREAQNRSIYQMAEALVDLIERGRNRRLLPSEMSGSTFTLSNLGMYDIESFTAVINPPESAILAVGKITETAVRSNKQVDFKPMMQMTVSADHRILDGASVARFMQALKHSIENPFFLAKGLDNT